MAAAVLVVDISTFPAQNVVAAKTALPTILHKSSEPYDA